MEASAAPHQGSTVGYDAFEAPALKHLEFIQAVISRLASNGFLLKGWALTVAGVFLGVAVQQHDARLVLVGVLISAMFWGLDGYFLRSERQFRSLYDRVASDPGSVKPFFMAATILDGPHARRAAARVWLSCCSRPAISLFHGPIIVSSLILAVLLAGQPIVDGTQRHDQLASPKPVNEASDMLSGSAEPFLPSGPPPSAAPVARSAR